MNGDMAYPPETGSRFLEIFQIFPGKYHWHPVFFVEDLGFCAENKKPRPL